MNQPRADDPIRDGRPVGPFNPHGYRAPVEPVYRDPTDRRERAIDDYLDQCARGVTGDDAERGGKGDK